MKPQFLIRTRLKISHEIRDLKMLRRTTFGSVTREEFAKMKTHPVVGAEILEQVDTHIPWFRS